MRKELFIAVIAEVLEDALRSGMAFNDMEAGLPAFIAAKLGMKEAQFHAMLDNMDDNILAATVDAVVAKFSDAECRTIATRTMN